MLVPATLILGLPGSGVYFIYPIFVREGGRGSGESMSFPSVALEMTSFLAV